MSKIVIALGGNAIQNGDDHSAESQQKAAAKTAKYLKKLIEQGHQIVIVHGNGPQVGNLILQQENSDSEQNPAMPLDSCVAMTQGMMGYWLQKEIGSISRYYGRQTVSIVTQIKVDINDPAFKNPTKPIGGFYKTEKEAELALSEKGVEWAEDSGRGYRRVVPSPKPLKVIEESVIEDLLKTGSIVVAAGGGGVSVYDEKGKLKGVEAVIDKDFSAAFIAKSINADFLIILTAVENVKIDFNTPKERSLGEISSVKMKDFINQNQFGAGSMLPKIQASVDFVESGKSKMAIITSLDNAGKIWNRKIGTRIKL